MKEVTRLICLSVISLAGTTQWCMAQQVPRPSPQMNLLIPCRGKPTLVAFVVTTCAHCKAFTRTVMQPLHEAGKACTVAIAFDEEGDVARFTREQGLTFPVYRLSREIVADFLGENAGRVMGTPQVVVIDKRGMIQAQSVQVGSPLLLQPAVIAQILEALR